MRLIVHNILALILYQAGMAVFVSVRGSALSAIPDIREERRVFCLAVVGTERA
jgi:hypothetical protein